MARSKELLKALQSIWGGGHDWTDSEPRATVLASDALEPATPDKIPQIPWPSNHLGAPVEQAAHENAASPPHLQLTPSSADEGSTLSASGDVQHLAGRAAVSLYLEDDQVASKPSAALNMLVDLYLHAARYRSRQIVLTWPASLRTAALVHVLATLERWHDGDKLGIRGLLFPVKTNAFHVLNHVHLDREAVLRHARNLVEGVAGVDDSHLSRRMRDKDPYLFALQNLKPEKKEAFNPTAGELLPHFLAGENFTAWTSCESRLLSHLKAKLEKRRQARALGENCAVIGDPRKAPDAFFAIDGRLDNDRIRRSLVALKAIGAPEVVVLVASRHARADLANWKGRLARFCLLLEEVFAPNPPGVVVVTDQPRIAFDLKQELWDRNKQRDRQQQWQTSKEYAIVGVPCPIGDEGLLPPGTEEPPKPVPREFRIKVVDAEAARVIGGLWKVAYKTEGGADNAQPVKEAAAFLGRLASLPCGLSHLAERLSSNDYTDRTRQGFDWMVHEGALREWDKSGACPQGRAQLLDAIQQARDLVTKYYKATPFAHLIATHVGHAVSPATRITVVFSTTFHCLLAESFLAEYDSFPDGAKYDDFRERVVFITSANLGSALDTLGSGELVFASINDDSLCALMTDNRIPPHTAVLLPQASAQFLRANLTRIREHVPGLRQYGARIDSILRQLATLPGARAPLGAALAPAPFCLELAPSVADGREADPAACWAIRLENGGVQYRADGDHLIYVYDPVSQRATDRGFRSVKVASLEPGDKLFVMTLDLREMMDEALAAAGVPLQSEKNYEESVRDYHRRVIGALGQMFPAPSLSQQVRLIRGEMARVNPDLANSLPREEAMRVWIKLDSARTESETMTTWAPGKEAHFRLFAEVLGLSSVEAIVYWRHVIQPFRTSRRLDGRHLGDLYAYLLLQPESALVNANLSRQTVQALFDKARESVVVVLAVEPPKKVLQ